MALEKKDAPAASRKVVSDTPSAKALDAVGPPPEGASDEELNAHAAKYAEAKSKARWG